MKKSLTANLIFTLILCFSISSEINAQKLEPLPIQVPKTQQFVPGSMTGYGVSMINIPIQLSLIPGVSTNPNYSFINNNLSMNMTLGDGYMLNGFQFSVILNRLVQELKGVQFALISNYTGGLVTGLQTSLIYNESSLAVNGVQLSAAVNYTFSLNGVQLGLANFHEIGNVVHRRKIWHFLIL